jgi:hypothetical protein
LRQREGGTVYRTHQFALLAAQKLSGAPIQPTPRMWADVQPAADITDCIAVKNQGLHFTIDARLALVQAIHWQGL